MPRALHAVPPLPSLRTALERFLARSRFAARTRESYAQDRAPLVAQYGDETVTSLTHQTTVAFLAAQEHLAATWARMTGGSAVALRYHNVYGPRMPRDTPYSGVAAIFRSALEGGTHGIGVGPDLALESAAARLEDAHHLPLTARDRNRLTELGTLVAALG